MGDTFDVMVEELVDYRLAKYLFTKHHLAGGGPAEGSPPVSLPGSHAESTA